MHRLLPAFLIINIVGLGSGHGGFHGRHGFYGHRHESGCNHNHQEENRPTSYTDVLQKLQEADEALKKFCDESSKVHPVIRLGMSGWTIEYSLPPQAAQGEVNVEVTITNKLLKTTVTMKNNQNSEQFSDVRVLSDMLNFNQAGWLISNGKLQIAIPYLVPLEAEFSPECGTVNNNVINVPVSQKPNFQYRFDDQTNSKQF